MTKILDEVLASNAKYAENFGAKESAASEPPFRDIDCMDARLDPVKYAGLAEGDAHVIVMLARASDDASVVVISYKLLGRGNGL